MIEQPEEQPLIVRWPVLELVRSMEVKLSANDHKKKWEALDRADAYWVLTKLREEVRELEDAMLTGTGLDVMLEAADVCNFALFIHDLARREGAIGEP